MLIAFQGEPGAYSEAAALTFSPGASVLPCPSFEEVFAAVDSGRASHGVLPLENSIGGSIHRNFDLLVEHELPIVAEVEVLVDHCLLGMPGTALDDVKVVYSHPQALAQCEKALGGMRGVELVAAYDTAGAAKMVRESGRRDAAAVASRRAAEVFGLAILRESIQDFADNITRFCVIANPRERTGEAAVAAVKVQDANKTSIVFALQSRPGALFKALAGFALRDINLTKLESRPLRGRPWEYAFYVDVEVPAADAGLQRAVADLREFSHWVRILGSYRAWKA
ncbi:MAG TPA: prephenate dehydratase [Vicinamibacterales bacterium]|nr:prephenate dehydratase [Vicinamibacterales bacterium]